MSANSMPKRRSGLSEPYFSIASIHGMRRSGSVSSMPITSLEHVLGPAFEDLQHVLLLDERHLAVDLRELGLTVGAQVLVAEAAHDLEIFVVAGHHQQLLERLRRLGQGVELVGRTCGWAPRSRGRLRASNSTRQGVSISRKSLSDRGSGGSPAPSCGAGSCCAAGADAAGRGSGTSCAGRRRRPTSSSMVKGGTSASWSTTTFSAATSMSPVGHFGVLRLHARSTLPVDLDDPFAAQRGRPSRGPRRASVPRRRSA